MCRPTNWQGCITAPELLPPQTVEGCAARAGANFASVPFHLGTPRRAGVSRAVSAALACVMHSFGTYGCLQRPPARCVCARWPCLRVERVADLLICYCAQREGSAGVANSVSVAGVRGANIWVCACLQRPPARCVGLRWSCLRVERVADLPIGYCARREGSARPHPHRRTLACHSAGES